MYTQYTLKMIFKPIICNDMCMLLFTLVKSRGATFRREGSVAIPSVVLGLGSRRALRGTRNRNGKNGMQDDRW